jgi:hypothetical protein
VNSAELDRRDDVVVRPSRRVRGVLACLLLAIGIAGVWWSIATGRITPGSLTIRCLAVLGVYDLATGAARTLRNLRRHRG